jgi:NADH-quinone oxidoreductase subunit M
MNETDLMWMSALIFAPTLFALVLLFVPKAQVELMRWIALLGTAVTLAISLIVLIGYFDVPGVLTPGDQAGLEKRVNVAAARQAITIDPQTGQTRGGAPADPNDWVARVPWIKAFNIEYYLGIDGISLPLIVLTTALCVLAMLASWKIEKHVRGYLMLFLLLETGMVGCFVALDFFLFYIFWEVMLLPMYFLIGVWGGPRREYAAIKFFLYTLLGSVFILIALLGFYFTDIRDFVNQDSIRYEKALQTARKAVGGDEGRARAAVPQFIGTVQPEEVHSFDLIALAQAGRKAFEIIEARAKVQTAVKSGEEAAIKSAQEAAAKVEGGVTTKNQPFFVSSTFQITMFLLLFVGFAIKVPAFPFHTWLPDAHVEAPTPISMILAGVLLKLGGYGILRIAYPICPWAAEFLAWPLCVFGVINIVYGAFAAMAQTDFKKLVAYSSVSHMGYVILGIAVWKVSEGSQYWWWGINGAMFQMIAHGITSAGMFFLVGVIYDRAHHRNLDNFRGLMEPMPLFGGISAIIFFAAMGLPGLCGFVGEVFVVLATWNFSKVLAILAALTVVLTAAYILWTVQRVYFGTNAAYKDYADMDLREVTIATPLVVFSVLLGIFPSYFLLSWMSPSIDGFVDALKTLGAR